MQFTDAKWVNEEKSAFFVRVKTDDGAEYPFGFNVDATEYASDIEAAVAKAFKAGDIIPAEYVAPIKTETALAYEARARRNRELSACDYYVMPDYPGEYKEQVKEYRQALRDISKQENFPRGIEWPEIPECLKGGQ